ncbi:MAG: N-acetylmuramoyl-L-alanine amidase [candidate division Zixibacteria bacterium]|nr:N-acetylmuramoyl-L-alanine amidase [candidate division Zixibacteria bacterium]
MIFRVVICLFTLGITAFAQNHIEVVYPKDGQQMAAVDSTFIFGNTNPEADLTINGYQVEIHKDGGFLAFLPIRRGDFKFDLISVLKGDYAFTKINIYVGPSPDSTDDIVSRSSISPSGRTVLLEDEIFEFSLKAKPGGQLFCGFADDSVWTRMYPNIKPWNINSVFGDVSSSDDDDYAAYIGHLEINGIQDSSRLYYLYEEDTFDTSGEYLCTEFEIDSTDYQVIRHDNLPIRTLRLVGRPHVIRTAPGKGYKLVNQPAGVRFRYAGETPDYYRLQLADGVSGFVRKADARLEDIGTPLPNGEVYFVTAYDFGKYVQVTMTLGDALPYEIHTNGNLMTIDIYGLTSDTDWIRFNDDSREYLESIWWSQPQDDVYRLNIRWYEDHYWGYEAGYEGGDFILKLKKRLNKPKRLGPSVKGLRIAIDPGHSHADGAVGPTGLTERNANLWIAHELRKILLGKGAEVLMTRMGHEDLGLYNRTDMAKRWEADLLISVHNNALPDGVNPFEHNGTSCYYYFNQARPLAEAIHKRLLKATGLPDHGLYYGNLALARVPECPAVLVECAFMMIPEQEAKLKTDKFQRKCAKAIYKGILDYLR